MKKLCFVCVILGGLVSNGFAATWYYDKDGCTKIYRYGYDSSECFDKMRNIKKNAGRNFLCNRYGYCF